tara:strand:+ start:650 stop:976 length:327 start_codon:yes stop_codon:yes gene_type:complete
MVDMYQTINGVRQLITDDDKVIKDGGLVGAKTYRETQIKEFEDAQLDRDLSELREKRNKLLAETDFYALSDVTMSDEMKKYRQDLRDLPSGLDTVEKVANVTYPTKPS